MGNTPGIKPGAFGGYNPGGGEGKNITPPRGRGGDGWRGGRFDPSTSLRAGRTGKQGTPAQRTGLNTLDAMRLNDTEATKDVAVF